MKEENNKILILVLRIFLVLVLPSLLIFSLSYYFLSIFKLRSYLKNFVFSVTLLLKTKILFSFASKEKSISCLSPLFMYYSTKSYSGSKNFPMPLASVIFRSYNEQC